MADVFSQLYIHLVFAVKYRQALIAPDWEEKLHKYITGIVQKRGHKMLAIGGMPDHIHIFVGFKPVESLSDLVREIKKASTHYVREERFTSEPFQWQAGYGAFSHSRSQLSTVCRYIANQKTHHQKKDFRKEFNKMLTDFGVETHRKRPFDFLLAPNEFFDDQEG